MSNTFEVLETGLKTLRDTLNSLQSEIIRTKEAIRSLEARPSDAGSAVQRLKDHLTSQKIPDPLSDMVEAFAYGKPITDWTNRLTGRCFTNVQEGGHDVSPDFIQTDIGGYPQTTCGSESRVVR